jgi:dihydrofolate reductase/thymidylate synthase
MFSLIAAVDTKNNIGINGQIPWYYKSDLQFFKKTTLNHVVIMGRKTYASFKSPLKSRVNIVLSHNSFPVPDGVILCHTTMQVITICRRDYSDKSWFVIGGAEIYNEFIAQRLISKMYISKIPGDHAGDTKFNWQNVPCVLSDIIPIDSRVECHILNVINKEEREFLKLMNNILTNGNARASRNEQTISTFGNTLQFDLRNNTFPLLTSRKMFLRGIFEEVMLFIRGQTDNEILEKKNISIWRGNTTREFLNSRNLEHLPVGDMGASYGFLFRHFGAKYVDCKTDYTGQGVDQLQTVINTIKNNPTDRRMIISLWDPTNLNNCPLPPCLYNYQFYVNDNYLSCMMTQRSSDYVVAGGWNIATGSLLTYLIARVCNLTPDKLIWNIGDTHIYNNLIDQAKEQILREPYQFPKIYISKKDNIESFEYGDIELIGYKSHPTINLVMNV